MISTILEALNNGISKAAICRTFAIKRSTLYDARSLSAVFIAFVYGVGFVPIMLLIGVIGFYLLSYKERKKITETSLQNQLFKID